MRRRQKEPIIHWHGPQVEAYIRKVMQERLVVVAKMLLEKLRRNISTPYPPASNPGEFPHLRTGNVRMGLTFHADFGGMRVFVTNDYRKKGHPIGKYLEEGTSIMAARPHMRRTMFEALPLVKAIMLKPVPGRRSFTRFFRRGPDVTAVGQVVMHG